MTDRPSRTPGEIARATRDGIARADRRIADGLAVAMASGQPSFDAVFRPLDEAARIPAGLIADRGRARRSCDGRSARQRLDDRE